jgi:beta-N-acetylhexosaminidase
VEISTRLASLLQRLQPAGVILFARNIKDPKQTWRLLRECQKCVSAPLFTCVDMEGGSVDRLRDALGAAPPAANVFATGDPQVFQKHGKVIGENCRTLGFNVDFAPVLDLAFDASHAVLGSRAVSADPSETVAYARAFLAGLNDGRVLGCGKHFPGLGEGKLDSHHERKFAPQSPVGKQVLSPQILSRLFNDREFVMAVELALSQPGKMFPAAQNSAVIQPCQERSSIGHRLARVC